MSPNAQVMVDSPPSYYHGLVGTVLELVDYGAVLTFSEAECDRVPDRRRVTHDTAIPFPHGSFVAVGQPIRPRPLPLPNGPPTALPHEVCGCGLFGPPCGSCGYCKRCNTRIKGQFFDTHAWRHYYDSQEHHEVLGIMRREQIASELGPPRKKNVEVFLAEDPPKQPTTPLKSSSKAPEPKSETPVGQVSLWG